MPLSLSEYGLAQMYMVTKMQRENTGDGEGVEVLINKPFKNDELGDGQYTFKVYHLESKFPSWITALAPPNCLKIEEESWNAYPKCKAVLKCTYFTRFKITIDTVHVADNGISPNVHNLDDRSLALRKVEKLDIASPSSSYDYWNYMIAGGSLTDLSSFWSRKAGRGPLLPNWQETCSPVMTAYKLVTVDAQYWGFGYRMEQALLGAEKALFLESHKRCFLWIDEWFDLKEEDIKRLEAENDAVLNKILHSRSKRTEIQGKEDGS